MLSILLSIAVQTLPFGTELVLPDGSTGEYVVEVVNTNRFGPWVPSVNGSHPGLPGQRIQYLSDGTAGWLGATLLIGSNGKPILTGNSGQRIDGFWNLTRPGSVRVALGPLMGAYLKEVWPKENALKIKCNFGRFKVKVTGSPSRCLFIEGNGNDVTVWCEQSEQSNNQVDLSAVYVKGSDNTIRGYASAYMCAVLVNGQRNRLEDLTVLACARGDDIGAIHAREGSDGLVCVRVRALARPRETPSNHVVASIYPDNRTSWVTIEDCSATGFMYGVFAHGGSNVRVRNWKGFLNGTEVKFAPFYLTPLVIPTGNSVN